MKKTNQYLANTRFGMDMNVLVTMLVLAVVATGLLAFKLSKSQVCKQFTISSASVSAGTAKEFYMGDPVNFIAVVPDNQQVTWDYGDHTPYDIGNTARHIYVRQGKFVITATVNDKCVQTITLNIKPITIQTDLTGSMAMNPIMGSESPLAGISATFKSTVKAEMYEWNVLNSPIFSTQNTDSAVFNFPIQGPQIIELKLNGDPTKVYRKQINVLPGKSMVTAPPPLPGGGGGGKNAGGGNPGGLPPYIPPIIETKKVEEVKEEVKKPDPEVEKPKETILVADEAIRMRFESVVRGEINVAGFDDILCSGGATRVLVKNDDNRWETVASICQLFFRNKKIKKVWDVVTERDPKKCVTLISLKYKKGFL